MIPEIKKPTTEERRRTAPEAIRARMSAVFNEWASRYAKDPEAFSDVLDKEGRPFTDYGDQCAAYFQIIAEELEIEGRMPPAFDMAIYGEGMAESLPLPEEAERKAELEEFLELQRAIAEEDQAYLRNYLEKKRPWHDTV